MSKIFSKIAATIICSGLIYSSAVQASGASYEVTITNLTKAQAFTPIVVASHRKGVKLFELGSPVSAELAVVAEDGNPGPLVGHLDANPKVVDVTHSTGLLMPGHSVTVTVNASKGAKEVSVASMMIPTNDSFIALNGVKAPKGNKTTVYYSPGYDAGSEPNDEDCLNIPGPVCKGEGLSDGAGGEGYVHISSGIHGIKDLHPNVYDWRNPTAKIVIKRIRH